jgi:hypothetical protein
MLATKTFASKLTAARAVTRVRSLTVWKTFGEIENYKPGKHQIKTLNKISPIGLARFPASEYDVRADESPNAHAILLRSFKLTEDDVPHTVRAIAR